MHEASLALSVIDACATELRRRGGIRATVVGLRIGSMASVDPEALRFSFDVLKQETPLDAAVLDIEWVDASQSFEDATALDIRYLEFDTEVVP